MVAHAFNPSTQGGRGRWISVSLRPAWYTVEVPGQSGLHRETLAQKQTKQNKTKQNKKEPMSQIIHLDPSSPMAVTGFQGLCAHNVPLVSLPQWKALAHFLL